MATGGRITPGSDISKMQYGLEALTLIAETSHAADRRVAAHVLTTEGIATCVHAGIDTLEHCRFQDPDGSYRYAEEVLARMAAQGTYVSLTMAGNMRDAMLARRADPQGYTPSEVDAGRFRTEADMVRRGLRTFVTSDAGVTRARFEEFPLSVACMCHLLGVDPIQAIAHATGRAAQALGIEAETGTIEPGKVADLIVVDGDPARDIDDLARIRTVYRGGRPVVRNGAVATAADTRKG
jgi:imidazolonepropionase-like amidohydrolase